MSRDRALKPKLRTVFRCTLECLAEYLCEGELLAVRALPDGYAHLDQDGHYVASVTATSIGRE